MVAPPERDAQERLPDADLEIGADQHDPQGLLRLPGEGIEDAPGERGGRGLVLDILGPRPAPPHVGKRRRPVAVVDEAEPGEAALGRDQDRLAEGRGVEAEAHGEPRAAGLEVARRHRLVGDEEVVQAARAGQADLVGRVEHARRVGEERLGVVERDRLQEGLRRQPAPAPEEVVHMGGRQPDMGGDRLERGLVAPALGDEGDDAAHALVIRGRAARQSGAAGFDGMSRRVSSMVAVLCPRL